jgi:IS30 family transposase
MRHYTQLTKEQRYQISALLKTGHSQAEIAKTIEKSKSTISRELKRNHGKRGYRPRQADQKAQTRKDKAKPRIMPEDWQVIEKLVCEDWSPEQIRDRIQSQDGFLISHEWIYQHILRDKKMGGNLYKHLRCQKKRRKRYGKYERRGCIPGRISIEERPAVVNERKRMGDWEVDTIFGRKKQQAIVTATERKSRFTLLRKVSHKTSMEVGDALIELLRPYPVLTITCDNGKEFVEHQRISHALKAQVYFAHPNSAWERGTNENTNGLIRQYFPKGSDFSGITELDVDLVMHRLNNRPRKCLGALSPIEVMLKYPCCT